MRNNRHAQVPQHAWLCSEQCFALADRSDVVCRTRVVLCDCFVRGLNTLKMGNQPNQRSFFQSPFHRFLPFRMGAVQLDLFHTLPDFIPGSARVEPSDCDVPIMQLTAFPFAAVLIRVVSLLSVCVDRSL